MAGRAALSAHAYNAVRRGGPATFTPLGHTPTGHHIFRRASGCWFATKAVARTRPARRAQLRALIAGRAGRLAYGTIAFAAASARQMATKTQRRLVPATSTEPIPRARSRASSGRFARATAAVVRETHRRFKLPSRGVTPTEVEGTRTNSRRTAENPNHGTRPDRRTRNPRTRLRKRPCSQSLPERFHGGRR